MMIDWKLFLFSIGAFLAICVGLSLLILFTKARFKKEGEFLIRINNDDSLTKKGEAGETLLHALTRASIPIPSPCGGKATCKQCRVRIFEGAEEPLETDVSSFSKEELKEGWRLSCQTKIHHDLSIAVKDEYLQVKEYQAKVLSNKNVATFIKELTVQLPDHTTIPYRSGGYLQIKIPRFKTNTDEWKETIDEVYWKDWEKYGMFHQELDFSSHEPCIRAYSLASYPAEKEKLMFTIRIATPPFEKGIVSSKIQWGMGSSYLFSLKAGDTIELQGPYGESFMKDDGRDLYFLIGGAGASFGRSHILSLFRMQNTKRNVSMWYGARSLRENIYQDLYEGLQKEFPNFSYHLVLSEPTTEDIAAGWPKDDPLKTAFLFKAFELGVLKKIKEPEEALYYVCGPPPHNKSVLKLLADYGVPRENIVLDDFGN